jgi:NADP-dependent 3-hydroxy acid dehydrogenase YdfG
MPEAAIAVVAGANSGIGKEIARQLLAAGLTVHIGARDADRCRAAVDELGGESTTSTPSHPRKPFRRSRTR